jgi:hypothetical protein
VRRWAAKAGLAAAALTGLALAQEAPKSILPPGFEDAPAPPAQAAPPPVATVPPPAATEGATPTTTAAPAAPAVAVFRPLPAPKADPNRIGPLTSAVGGYGPALFATSPGRYAVTLMRRIDAPVASRWVQIVTARALLSATPPRGVGQGDWVAERASLLARMGDVWGANALITALPQDRFTRRTYQVAAQARLAAADLPGLCPLAPTARTLLRDPVWPLMDATCAALEGDDLTAATVFDALRGRKTVDPFDLSLAEKVAAAVTGGGKAANVEWQNASRLTAYRFGMAAATGVMPSTELLQRSPAVTRAWIYRSPAAPMELRVTYAPVAAALGVASSAEMVKLYAAQAADMDPVAYDGSPASRLRLAYTARTSEERLTAMRTLWTRGRDPASRYGMKVLTAQAAARVPVSEDLAEAAPELVESMLTSGYRRAALRWWPVADDAGGAARDKAWGWLAVADTGRTVDVSGGAFDRWVEAQEATDRRAAFLAAALLGLGKPGDWSGRLTELGYPPLATDWTRAIEQAARARRSGDVMLLAATGMQTRDWANVPPRHLARIIAAYRMVGRGEEARLLAAEALSRG